MSKRTTFLASLRGKELQALQSEVTKRDAEIRTLKFDLGFGKVDALAKLRTAKRERAQLLTLIRQLVQTRPTQKGIVKVPKNVE